MDRDLCDQCHRIRTLNRALQIPSINYLWDKSIEVYGRVKEVNTLVKWGFDTMETVVGAVIERSLPVARLMEKPIYSLDNTLCQGIDFVEVKLPIIKEKPEYIIDRTKSIVSQHLRPAVQTLMDLKQETEQRVRIISLHTYCKAHYLRIYSWRQVDRVMSTETGINILKTVDNTTDFAEFMLDKYLPAPYEQNYCDTEPQCSEHFKLHHTVVRLTEFSSRASKRIYLALTDRLQYMYKIEILVLILHTLIIIQTIKFFEAVLTIVLKTVLLMSQ